MSGIDRYTRILDLFTEGSGVWTVARMAEELKTSASTLYRLVRELVAAGFLESTVDAQYRLGPAFVNYDRRIRLTDPLLRSGAVFLQPLVDHVGMPATAILARLFGSTVMCVADAKAAPLTIKTSFERGRKMPLTRGATSRAILACVETRRLRRLIAAEGHLAPAAQEELLASLSRIRRDGHSVTRGEVDAGAVGLAVPLRNRDLGVEASLSVIVAQTDLTGDRHHHVLALLVNNARLIESFMEAVRAGASTDSARS